VAVITVLRYGAACDTALLLLVPTSTPCLENGPLPEPLCHNSSVIHDFWQRWSLFICLL